MIEIEFASQRLNDALWGAEDFACSLGHEYLLPEHLLYAISEQEEFRRATDYSVTDKLLSFLEEHVEKLPIDEFDEIVPEPSAQFIEAMNAAYQQMCYADVEEITIPHVISAIATLKDSFAASVVNDLMKQDDGEFLANIIGTYQANSPEHPSSSVKSYMSGSTSPNESRRTEWKQYVTCLNSLAFLHNPLVGRDAELERTMQILCRKDKNNVIHIGEPGVGKTAIAYELALRIEQGRVPEKLKGCKVYMMDLGGMIAGTAYRGEFEKRLKEVLDGAMWQKKPGASERELGNFEPAIIYIDEIHNVIGAGKIDKGSLDASNILKPYLEGGKLRFMGSTTYEEYNQNFVRSKGFARRFERVDIAEPTVEECVQILHGLKKKYEEFHNVTFTDEAIRYAAEGADKYITGRYLPDKAIDLLDEAGAAVNCKSPDPSGAGLLIDRQTIAQVLAK
ncbi:MAG: AAA family ATPase, partial [Prevotella sp.]|nr:AAA family ATPase [Prevotella sp.]